MEATSAWQKAELNTRPQLEIGKTYINRLGERFTILAIDRDDQVIFEHVKTGVVRRLPRPFLIGEFREEGEAGMLDRHAWIAIAVVSLLFVLGLALSGIGACAVIPVGG